MRSTCIGLYTHIKIIFQDTCNDLKEKEKEHGEETDL